MAAPSTAYHNQKLLAGVGNPSNMLDLGTVREMQIAKFIQNTSTDSGDGYFNAADDLATRVTKIKDIFKLDKLYPVPLGTDIGFIGMVEGDANNYPVSANAVYHNQVRFSAVPMVSGTDGKLYILLLDAGLNLMGECFVDTIYARWCNYLRFSAYFRSSYYNTTTQHGAIVNSITYNRGTIAPKVVEDESFILLAEGITPGATIGFETFVTNEEGTVSDTTSATALEKIWAATGAGDGVGGGSVYKLTNANDPIGSGNLYNSNGFFMTLLDFIMLDDLPVQGQLPTEKIVGYKTDALYDTTTPTLVEEGYYYIYNYTTDVNVPILGNVQGTSGKVFYADANGEFQYYIARAVSIPTVKVYTEVADGSVNIRAVLVSASGGVEEPFNNNFGVNIVISVGIRWYNDLVSSAVFGSTVTPTSNTLTILQGESLSNIRQFTIDDPSETPAYVAAYELSKTPAPNGSNYSGAVYLRTLY